MTLLCLVAGSGARAQTEPVVVALLRAACAGELRSTSLRSRGAPESVRARGRVVGTLQRYIDAGGAGVSITRIAPDGTLRNMSVVVADTASRPQWFAAAGPDCVPQTVRRLIWGREWAEELVHLDPATGTQQSREPLNPAVPSGRDPGGIRVGLIDSGVNYVLPEIAPRLARDKPGHLLGYDFWDLDPRPFDAHPVRSPFFPQRHGTRTASVLLGEAPAATALVPYRYPRPDMDRMGDLIAHAADHGVRILALPMGSRREAEWLAFERAARAHPELLFIVSAGNEGRNIDLVPSYPATFRLDNMIVVTSADQWGRPAAGTNWGPVSVDLMVPAERRHAQDFDGAWTRVSGSSYAVARLAALAARLWEQHPRWSAAQLKGELFARAWAAGTTTDVRVGLLPDPLARPGEVSVSGRRVVDLAVSRSARVRVRLDIALLKGSGWKPKRVEAMVRRAAQILSQCALGVDRVRLYDVESSERLLDFDAATAKTIVDQAGLTAPAVYLVRDTLRRPAFEAEAFGIGNTPLQHWLRHTVWMTASVRDDGIALAHELFHVLTDDGAHSPAKGNLMHERTSEDAIRLSEDQCARLRAATVEQQLGVHR